MKKILTVLLAVSLAAAMTACGAGNVGGSSSASASSGAASQAPSSQAVSSAPSASSYDNTLDGLEKYLTANSVVSGSPTAMQAAFIGAKSGAKYQFGLNGNNNVTVELYEFDPSSLNDTAKTVQADVKSKGSFTIMSQQVNAVLSDSGRFLVIYKDTVTNNDQNKARQQQTEKLVKEFQK